MGQTAAERLQTEESIHRIRLTTVGSLALVELIHYHLASLRWLGMSSIPAHRHHQQVVFLVLAWVAFGLFVRWLMQNDRVLTSSIFSIFTDVALLVGLAGIGEGQKSVWLAGLFVVIGSAAARRSLSLIRIALILSILGYLSIWRPVQWFVATTPILPLYQQLLFLLALVALAGFARRALDERTTQGSSEQAHQFPSTGRAATLFALGVAWLGVLLLEPILGVLLLVVALPAAADVLHATPRTTGPRKMDVPAVLSILALGAGALGGFAYSVVGEYLLIDSFVVRVAEKFKDRVPFPSGVYSRWGIIFVGALLVLLFADWTFSRRRRDRVD